MISGKALIALIAVVGFAMIPAMAAGQGGTTSVSIKENNGDFEGKVLGNPPPCRADRKVTVKRKQPGKDPAIASDTSETNGTWSTGNTSADPGTYYAKVKRTNDCAKAKSGTVEVD